MFIIEQYFKTQNIYNINYFKNIDLILPLDKSHHIISEALHKLLFLILFHHLHPLEALFVPKVITVTQKMVYHFNILGISLLLFYHSTLRRQGVKFEKKRICSSVFRVNQVLVNYVNKLGEPQGLFCKFYKGEQQHSLESVSCIKRFISTFCT